MMLKTAIVVAIYLAILLMLLQVTFTTVEKTTGELSLFTAEFSNWQSCEKTTLLRYSEGDAVYNASSDCHGNENKN